ncbi:MAG: dihydroorotate dehydrogenase-like protein [Proteobacteria bacterium]|jgi:dihydroorotate dehydrogenase (fumarate)|nr:dihydroorotate dehydrogenase-like protein [Pseudomonadota bacterium]
MANLKTTYMGIELDNPIIAASCGLVSRVEGVQRVEEAGAGAVVLKSLFEEQIRLETADEAAGVGAWDHPEAGDFMNSEVWMQYGTRDYCGLIEECKKKVEIPIFASVNCVGGKWWTSFAKDLEAAGADGIELNIWIPGTDRTRKGGDVEQEYIDIVGNVTSQVGIPVAAKIGFSFASLAYVTHQLVESGAKALVMFNRFHRPDIDIEALTLKSASPFSEAVEMQQALRWIGLLSSTLDCDLVAATGLHDSEQVIKQLLAGAAAAQVCSSLYRHGLGHIGTIVEGLEAWMERHDFDSLADFRGKLSRDGSESAAVYERSQYIRQLVGIY